MTAEQGAKPAWLRAAPLLFLLLWSGGYTFAKIGTQYAEPLTLLSLRFALALAVLLLIAAVIRPPMPRRMADYRHLAVTGLLIQALYFGPSWYALSLGMPAGTVALIQALQPLLVALLAQRVVGEAVTGRAWAGLALGFGGTLMVILARSEVTVTSLEGTLLAAAGLLAMTLATLYQKRFGTVCHPVSANLVQYAVGFAAVLPAALLLEEMHVTWSGELFFALGYLVLGNSLVAITLLMTMLRHGAASRVSALFFLVPPVAALIAWALLGEQLAPLAWFGMAVATSGVLLIHRAPSSSTA